MKTKNLLLKEQKGKVISMKENKIKVVEIKVGEYARIVKIDNTLEALQKAVGGWIEACYPFADEVAIVCNEENKINGSKPNRALELDILFGDFLIVYAPRNSENFMSLPDDLAKKYRNLFFLPQDISFSNRSSYVSVAKAKTPLTEEEKKEVVTSLYYDEECSFEKMLGICKSLYENIPYFYSAWTLNNLMYAKLEEKAYLQTANLLKSLSDNEKTANYFYYDETVLNGFACPIKGKIDLFEIISGKANKDMFYRNYKKAFPEYDFFEDEAYYRLNENNIREDLIPQLTTKLVDVFFERCDTFICGDVIDNIVDTFLRNERANIEKTAKESSEN